MPITKRSRGRSPRLRLMCRTCRPVICLSALADARGHLAVLVRAPEAEYRHDDARYYEGPHKRVPGEAEERDHDDPEPENAVHPLLPHMDFG